MKYFALKIFTSGMLTSESGMPVPAHCVTPSTEGHLHLGQDDQEYHHCHVQYIIPFFTLIKMMRNTIIVMYSTSFPSSPWSR